MVAQKGSLFILKVGNGGDPETFSVLGGIQQTSFSLKNQAIEAGNSETGQWQVINDGAGIKSLTISGRGMFMDSAAEETFRGYAFNSAVKNYELNFGNSHKITGPFFILNYQRVGNVEDEELFQITLESAGAITYA